MEIYGPLVYYWARQKKLESNDANEITQRVFVKVVKSIDRFQHKRFRGWLATITHHELADWWKEGNRQRQGVGGTQNVENIHNLPVRDEAEDLDSSVEFDDPATNADAYLAKRLLEMAAEDFRPKTVAAFVKRFVEGREVDDIAEELGMSKEAVFKAYGRVRKRLRERAQELDDFDPGHRLK